MLNWDDKIDWNKEIKKPLRRYKKYKEYRDKLIKNKMLFRNFKGIIIKVDYVIYQNYVSNKEKDWLKDG